jgi:alpha-1,6-mannosyltransferase
MVPPTSRIAPCKARMNGIGTHERSGTIVWRAVAAAALTALAAVTFVFLRHATFATDRHAPLELVAIALLAWLVVLVALTRAPRALSAPVIALAGLALGVACVAAPPRQSSDLYSYAMYGRILAVHHANPYVAVPALFRHDPLYHLVTPVWRHTPSRYGVLFTLLSALGAWLVGGSVLALRLWFQIAALLALIGVAVVVWRRTRSTLALALVVLNPFVLLSVLNGGHNDALVALGLLVGVLLVRDDHLVAGAIVLGATSLVKVTAFLAVVAVVVWLALRRRWQHAALFGGVAGALTAWCTVPVHGELHALYAGDSGTTPDSLWWLVRLYTDHHSLLPWHGPQWDVRQYRDVVSHAVPLLALVAFLVAVLLLKSRRALSLEAAAVLALSAYVVFGGWVLPWYAVWALPLAAIAAPPRLRWVVAVHGALLLALQQVPYHEFLERHSDAAWWTLLSVPVLVLALYCAAVIRPVSSASTMSSV